MRSRLLYTGMITILPLVALLITNRLEDPYSAWYSHTGSVGLVPTASCQFSYLNTIPAAFFFTHRRTNHLLGLRHTIFTILLCLSGSIEPNPGPDFSICSLNIRSLNADHSLYLNDILSDHHSDLVALSETWLSTTKHTPSELTSLTPPGYELLSCPRKSGNGGGVAFLVRQPLSYSFEAYTHSSFEAVAVTVKLSGTKLTALNVYRPPDTSRTSKPFAIFLSEFQSILAAFATLPHHFVITGDFNIHVDDPSNSHTKQFSSLLSSMNLTQHVTFPTHSLNHVLDLVITASDSLLNPSVSSSPLSPSDHFPIFTSLNLDSPPTPTACQRSFRRLAAINLADFILDIQHSELIRNPPALLGDLVKCYSDTLSSILDKHAPLITKPARANFNPWYTASLHMLKSACRTAENIWKRSHSFLDKLSLQNCVKQYHDSIKLAKQKYYSDQIASSRGNPRQLWNTVNKVLHRKQSSPLPSPSPSLPSLFGSFFQDKIAKLRDSISSNHTHPLSPHDPTPASQPGKLLSFEPVTVEEIEKLLSHSPDKQCDLDPLPTFLLKKCSQVLSPTIATIINLSMSTGTFPDSFKHSILTPLLKKPTLDKENLSNYRPISNLSLLSKLTEKVVKNRLIGHLSSHSMLNPHQSAYIKSHSTETVLLSLHDHLIQQISQQQLTGLCLLDLSAAFDTIDHTTLLQRLNIWFGIDGTALSWLSSYLSSRTFAVSALGSFSPHFTAPHGVPQGSVLGPLLFILYTTPLSTVISSTSVEHHLYADDTQLYISFKPHLFSDASSSLQSTFKAVSAWMAANLLALNSSKTEFLIIGSPQQLAKLVERSVTLTPETSITASTSARNLGFIFDTNVTYHEQISAITKACFFHIRDLRRIRPFLDMSTAADIATSLVQSKLDYCNSLYLNLPACELDRLQLIQNALARTVCNSSRFMHITPALHSLHWLKIRERITYKVISLTYNTLQTAKPAYLARLVTVQPPRSTRSSNVVTLSRPPLPPSSSCKKILDRSFSYTAPRLWNDLPPNLRHPKPVSDTCSAASIALSRKTFHSKLKTHLFQASYPTVKQTKQTRKSSQPAKPRPPPPPD